LVCLEASVLLDLAEIPRLAGRTEEAAPLVDQAVALFELKGNHLLAAKARGALVHRAGEPPPKVVTL
jgi:hypothetical protein